MDRTTTPNRLLTVEEYLAREETSAVKHEYVAGEVYALAGASKRHNAIAVRIAVRLGNQAEGGPCRVYVSDVKVRVDDVFYYPDVMVACEPEGGDRYIEMAPCVIVEVTSPSTSLTDRREKLGAYQRIPSLKAYIIADQERRWITRYWRDEEGAWSRADVLGEGVVPIPCPELRLTMSDIYAGIEELKEAVPEDVSS